MILDSNAFCTMGNGGLPSCRCKLEVRKREKVLNARHLINSNRYSRSKFDIEEYLVLFNF